MANESGVEDECLPPDFGMAAEPFRAFAMFTIVFALSAIVSGGLLWFHHREKVFLQRRNPALVSLLAIPVLANLISGPVYRWDLNTRDGSFLDDCFLGKIAFILTMPSLLIPNVSRIINFHYRVQLHKKVSQSNEHLEKEPTNDNASNTNKGSVVLSTNSHLGIKRTKNQPSSYAGQSTMNGTDLKVFKEIKGLRKKASSRFTFEAALILLAFSLVISLAYAFTHCSAPAFGIEHCEFGFVSGLDAGYVALPILPCIPLYIYFGRLVQTVPDPFEIRREITVFFRFIGSGIFIGALSLSGIGERDGKIYFTFSQLLDIVLIFIFIHAVHYQVYRAVYFQGSFKRIVPVSFKDILAHPQGQQLFETFLQSDFSVENLKVYQIVTKWKKDFKDNKDGGRRDVVAKNIFRRWMDPNNTSAVGVNVSYPVLTELSQRINSTTNYPVSLFDGVLQEIMDLMEDDSFSRFINTDEYRVFVGIQDANQTNVEDNI